MRKLDPRAWAVLLGMVLVLAGAGCGGDDESDKQDGASSQGDAALETVREGTLTVGSDIPFPPFEQGRGPDYEGFDIDLIREIANRLELELRVQDTPFDTIFRDLGQGKFDVVASATTITPERERAVDFANPYYLAEQAILAEQGAGIAGVEGLAGKTVGAQKGTTGADYANDETDAKTVRTYGEADDAYNALQAGQVDAVIIDLPAAQQAAADKNGLEVVTSVETGEEYGFALQEEADSLRKAVNEALTEIKQDGTYEEIYREYFDKKPPAEILDATHMPS